MTIQEIRIGDKVQDRNGFEFEVIALFKDGTVHCNFDGNEADIWEFKVDELKRVVNDVVGRSEQFCSCSFVMIMRDVNTDVPFCAECGKMVNEQN